MDLLNHFNGISLIIIMGLSYFAVLKSTQGQGRINQQRR